MRVVDDVEHERRGDDVERRRLEGQIEHIGDLDGPARRERRHPRHHPGRGVDADGGARKRSAAQELPQDLSGARAEVQQPFSRAWAQQVDSGGDRVTLEGQLAVVAPAEAVPDVHAADRTGLARRGGTGTGE